MVETASMDTTDTRRIAWRQYTPYRKVVHAVAMDSPAQRLRDARKAAGYDSAQKAADAMGIGGPGYRHHENGTREIDYETAKRYAKFFKTAPEWLLDGRRQDETDPGPRQARKVALLSWVGAGRLGPVAPIESIEASGALTVERLPPGEYVGLSVEGGSMDRIAADGSTIIVNRNDKRLVNRKFYVFVASDGEATFKRYRTDPERYVPYSSNPDEEPIYPELEPDRDWQVFGRVYRVITDI